MEQKEKGAVGSIRPGGRTSRTRAAVLEATRALLVSEGPAGMRMEKIAARSDVHRSSLYRRWANPAGIVADLAAEFETVSALPPGDCLEDDLRALASRLAANLDGDGAALVRALLAWNDPDVRAILDRFWHARAEATAEVLARHGCPADARQVNRLLAGQLHYIALIEGRPCDQETVKAAVKHTLLALQI